MSYWEVTHTILSILYNPFLIFEIVIIKMLDCTDLYYFNYYIIHLHVHSLWLVNVLVNGMFNISVKFLIYIHLPLMIIGYKFILFLLLCPSPMVENIITSQSREKPTSYYLHEVTSCMMRGQCCDVCLV